MPLLSVGGKWPTTIYYEVVGDGGPPAPRPKGGPPRPPGAPFLFSLVAVGVDAVEWRPADVRANRGPTGRLTKAQKEGRVRVGVADVVGCRLYLDV